MRVLGIESSCDETAAAVVEGGWTVRSNVIASQAELHAPFGGVVPEIASRRHVELVTHVIQEALDQAGMRLDDVEGLAVTNRPGLIGSLLVGVTAAKGLALGSDLPLVGVHHIEGHVFSSFLAEGGPQVPAVALIASGGHTELYYVRDLHDYFVMGRRRDDAAGEAFDKGARLLGLGSGGGAALDRLAREGDPEKVPFPKARTEPPLDFSFSGVKTALLRFVQEDAGKTPLAEVAAGYQRAIVDALAERAVLAVQRSGAPRLLVGGGVAANSTLQARLRAEAELHGFEVSFPPPSLCTDNAAMIAAVGHSLLDRGVRHGLDLETQARAPLTEKVYR
ncbi:MAG: tRNA (adenosine(37)-N6)-threonylcarbamoyltransferase complex transferase subunit TsaD [Armatimonadota bacterium]